MIDMILSFSNEIRNNLDFNISIFEFLEFHHVDLVKYDIYRVILT